MITRRIAAIVPTAFLALFVAMFLLQLAPTDPAAIIAGVKASPADIARVRRELGLNLPFFTQYAHYAAKAFRGNLGTSYATGQSVSGLIAHALPVTASLVLVAVLFALLLAVPFGVLAALHRDRLTDRALTVLSSMFVGVPPFVVALVLVTVFSLQNHWLPSGGYQPLASGLVPWLRSLLLPGIALALPLAAELSRQIRGALVDVMEEDFIRSQHAKGLPLRRVIGKHCAKNAAVPVVTVLGLQLGQLLGGAVLIEVIFTLPGIGYLAADAVGGRDFPLVQGIVLVTTFIVMMVNLLVDLSYLYLDPRSRRSSA